MLGCKLANSPIEVNHKLRADEAEKADKGTYQRLVKKLISMSHTRPDIMYVVKVVNQFM